MNVSTKPDPAPTNNADVGSTSARPDWSLRKWTAITTAPIGSAWCAVAERQGLKSAMGRPVPDYTDRFSTVSDDPAGF